MHKAVLILVLFFANTTGFSQHYLVIKKRNKVIAVFEQGDQIKIKLNNEDYYTKLLILGFSEDEIMTRFYEIKLSEIEQVKGDNITNKGLKFISGLAITAGVFFISIDQVNKIIKGRGITPDEKTLLISGTMIGTGLFLKLFNKNKFRVDRGKYHLEIVEFIPRRR